MQSLQGKVLFITGASRGIGKAIALRAAKDGAMIAIASKTETPHPKLPGTIYQTAEEIQSLGGQALPLAVDIRDEERVARAVEETVHAFGGIDILVNNASAVNLQSTVDLPIKRYQLMHSINVRGTFLCSQACLPHLKKAANPHILNMSPPLNIKALNGDHTAYTASKLGMSMCVLGMSVEFARDGIAVNALWPQTVINTSALHAIISEPALLLEIQKRTRLPTIVADAAHYILTQPSRQFTGKFLTDEGVLKKAGVVDFSKYAVAAGEPLLPDYFLE